MAIKIVIFYFLLGSYIACGQANSKVIVPSFDDAYCETVKKLEEGITNVNFQDFRFSFIESQQFIVAKKRSSEFDSLKKQMYKLIREKDYSPIIDITKQMLSIDYTSLIAHKILRQTYKILGDTVNSKKYHDIQFGLLYSIVRNGDGKTCETAWPVIQIEEEYFILEVVLDAKLQKQSIDNKGGLCDKMEVKVDRKKKTYYFDTQKVFQGYKKLGL